MIRLMKIVFGLGLLLFVLSGCSVYKVLSQPGPVDLKGIGLGTPRQELLARFGAPAMVDSDAHGNKVDVFQFQSGYHQASKIRALPYLAADIFTLTAAELILWPIEMTAMEAATCSATATYDNRNRVSSWYVGKKTESQGLQDC